MALLVYSKCTVCIPTRLDADTIDGKPNLKTANTFSTILFFIIGWDTVTEIASVAVLQAIMPMQQMNTILPSLRVWLLDTARHAMNGVGCIESLFADSLNAAMMGTFYDCPSDLAPSLIIGFSHNTTLMKDPVYLGLYWSVHQLSLMAT